jgi:hypothetical protein
MNELPKIGAFVLETLTTGMYTNPLDTIREFVQNATDSILRAEGNLIPKATGRIEVKIDPEARTFGIRDNGIGVPKADFYGRLVNIGMSNKDFETDAGFRGIGRLAGIAYCKTLYFRASASGEKTISTIEIDCEAMRRVILPSMRQVEELADVMGRNSKLVQEKSTTDEHFFEVVMEGVTDAAEDFLNWQMLESYLAQVAPVGFDAQRFFCAPTIMKWVELQGISIPTVTLVIKTPDLEREVFKSYKTHYKTRKTRAGGYDFYIKDICFYPESLTQDSTFWLWYGKTDLLGAIKDSKTAGLRLRKSNISIGGPERVRELFAETAQSNSRFNGWYIGEIHIITPEAIPNARRDGFEEVKAWPEIKEELIPFIRKRVDEARQVSRSRNRPTEKIIRAAQEVITEAEQRLETGFVSQQQRETVLKRLGIEHERVSKAIETRQDTADAQRLKPVVQKLNETRQILEEEGIYTVKRLRSDLTRKQRRVVSEVLEILYQTLDKKNYEKAESAILARFQIQTGDLEQ